MSDLVAFVRARLNEDYYLAHRFAFTGQADWDAEMLGRLWWYGPGDAPKFRPAGDPIIQHVARHDPARVLREVEAMRAIVDLHHGPDACTACATWDSPPSGREYPPGSKFDIMGYAVPFPCPTVRQLATIWRDHADYDPAWAGET